MAKRWIHLVPAAANGDALFRFAMLRLRDPDGPEEVVQKCFVAAIASSQGFCGRSSERTWLTSILKRKVVDRIRGRWRETNTASTELRPDWFDERGLWKSSLQRWKGDPSAAIQTGEFSVVLNGCLENLPAGVVEVFLLREMDRMNPKVIRATPGISLAKLWQRLHRARLAFRRCLELNWFQRSKDRT